MAAVNVRTMIMLPGGAHTEGPREQQQRKTAHPRLPRLQPVLRMSALNISQPNCVHSLNRAKALLPPQVHTRCSAAAMLRTGPKCAFSCSSGCVAKPSSLYSAAQERAPPASGRSTPATAGPSNSEHGKPSMGKHMNTQAALAALALAYLGLGHLPLHAVCRPQQLATLDQLKPDLHAIGLLSCQPEAAHTPLLCRGGRQAGSSTRNALSWEPTLLRAAAVAQPKQQRSCIGQTACKQAGG